MNYREYQQVMKLTVTHNKKESSSAGSTRVTSPLSSPLSSPRLAPHCSHSDKDNNYKIQKKPKITRSKSGCLCCRRRRKKCDEVHPKCGGCTRNFLDCCWPVNNVSSAVNTNPLTLLTPCTSDDEIPKITSPFTLNNNVMVIQDEHLVTQTSKEKSGDGNFIITLIKTSSVNHMMKDNYTEFPKAISIRSLLN